MPILIVGVDHREAPIALRERLAIPVAALPAALARLRETLGQGLILSTCNRTELVVGAGHDPADAVAFLAAVCGMPPAAVAPHLRHSTGVDALARLLRIVGGLESLVVGEDQILAQFKAAYAAAADAGTLDATLHRVGQGALTTGKRVRAETAIARGNLSVVSVALRDAARRLGGLGGRAVLVVGAGETGELALKHLTKGAGARLARLALTNRTDERARLVAGRYGATAVPWAGRDRALTDADLVISCTAAPEAVIGRPAVAAALRARPERLLLCYDLAVPRDIAPEAADLPGVTVRAVDDLATAGDAARLARADAAEAASAIVEQEARAILAWHRARTVVPAIGALREHAGAIRDAEVARALARLPALSARDEAVVRDLAASLVNKLLHRPVATLKRAEDGTGLARAVGDLFWLDSPPAAGRGDTLVAGAD